jgi:hypothetical protein
MADLGCRHKIGARFSVYLADCHADPKILKRRIEASLAKATSQQLKQIHGHVRQVMES